MSAAHDLLSVALDSEGFICIVGIHTSTKQIKRQEFFAPNAFDAAVAAAENLNKQGLDAYWGTSTFLNNVNRLAANTHKVKVLKLDLDVGAGDHKYPTKRDAAEALQPFCAKLNLPAPTLVDSGNGVHVYWILETALDAAQARTTCDQLKAVCAFNGLKSDPTVTADLARILRVPGTLNYKNPVNPRKVRLMSIPQAYATAMMVELVNLAFKATGLTVLEHVNGVLPFMGGLPVHLQGVALDDLTRSLMVGKPKKFSIILRKSIQDKGCAQIKYINDHQAEPQLVDEPRWRAGLSIAQFCTDRDDAIHTISRAYPGYSATETDRKSSETKGPYTCNTFQTNWPTECEGCPFAGKITSPIQLGEYVEKATDEDNIVLAQDPQVENSAVQYIIPTLPFPYFRGKQGGVYLPAIDEDELPLEVCTKDLYVDTRLVDDDGYYMQMKLHTGMDGIRNFLIPTEDIGSTDKISTILNKNGLMVGTAKEAAMLRNYVKNYFDHLDRTAPAVRIKMQFGWADDYKSFTVGSRELSASAVKFSKASPHLSTISSYFSEVGTLDAWKAIANTYAKPGMEAHALMALIGFASPLVTFTQMSGVVVHAYSVASGNGKSTAQLVATSVWGNPKALTIVPTSTAAAVTHRMGVYNSISMAVDEVTNFPVERIGNMLFSASQGKGGDRMESAVNRERVNDTTWRMILTTSANKSISELLQATSSTSFGELMRLVEIPFPETKNMSKREADLVFSKLEANYGMAGPIFIRYVMANTDRVRRMIDTAQAALDKECDAESNERFWSATFACIYVAGLIAVELGLVEYDMAAIRKYILHTIVAMRTHIQQADTAARNDEVLGEFMALHFSHTLIVTADDHNGSTITSKVPSGELVARYERDTKTVFVLQSKLRSFCYERSISIGDFIQRQTESNKYLGSISKKLGAGTAGAQTTARCFAFVMDDTLPDATVD